MIDVRFYSHLRRALGTDEVQLPAASVGELIDQLTARFGEPLRERLPHCKVFVNGSHVGLHRGKRTRLKPGDEVVFLPPVGGG